MMIWIMIGIVLMLVVQIVSVFILLNIIDSLHMQIGDSPYRQYSRKD